MKKLVLIAALLVLMVPMAVFADNVTFNTVPNGSNTSWSYGGGASDFTLAVTDGPSVGLSTALGSYSINGGGSTKLADLTVSLTTGAGTPLGTKLVSFANTGSSWSIYGTFGACTDCLIASGTLNNASLNLLSTSGSNNTGFTANFLVGSITSAWLSFSGMVPPNVTAVTGDFSATLNGTFNVTTGGKSTVAGSTTTLTQAPEPATLSLLAAGLIGAAGTLRRRK